MAKKKSYFIYAFIGYFAVSIALQRSFVFSFPHHIHAWAHCDHYAIAKGFVSNDFDFFHPQTFVFNKQFPNADGSSIQTSNTAVDFPINNYIVAILMKLLNTDSPAVFRLYTLIVACIGLSYLFLITNIFTRNWIISFCLPVIVVFTPIYLDYQVGFLPSISALTLFFGGVYYFIKYGDSFRLKYLVWTVFFFSFAALIRTPFVIHLIALLGYLFVYQIWTKNFKIKPWLIVISGFALPVAYFLYNVYLRDIHGSIFLSSPMLFGSIAEAKDILHQAYETWNGHYFNEFQYILLYVVLISITLKIFLSKFELSEKGKQLVIWLIISSIGVLLYSILMIPQFKDHDYYFLDTFYPILFILLVYVLANIKYDEFTRSLSNFGVFFLAVIIFSASNSSLKGRRQLTPDDLYTCQYNAYSELEQLLANSKIGINSKLLVIDAYAPNMAFILSNTSGYSLIYRSKEDIQNAMQFDFDYITVSKSYFFNHLLVSYPDFTSQVLFVAQSDKLILLKKGESSKPFELTQFLHLAQPLVSLSMDASSCTNGGKLINNEESRIENTEFALTYHHTFDNSKSNYLVHVTGEIKATLPSQIIYISDVNKDEAKITYQSQNIIDFVKESKAYTPIDFYVFLENIPSESEGAFFFYLPNKDSFEYRNFKFELF